MKPSYCSTNVSRGEEVLPLAITRAEGRAGCIAALDCKGDWIRPEPVTEAQVSGEQVCYRYRHSTRLCLAPRQPGGRREDRPVLGIPQLLGPVDPAIWRKRLLSARDTCVTQAFSADRTVGLVRARVASVYTRRHTRGRWFARMEFTDDAGEQFDWIVPEVKLVDILAPQIDCEGGVLGSFAQMVCRALSGEVFLTIGLTLPNDRMPGRFGGCHPLVVGIHSFPDYLEQLAETVR